MGDSSTRIHIRDHAKEAASRISKCISACEGIDDSMLELLASKDRESGKTNMQKLVAKIEVTSGIHKALDPKYLESIESIESTEHKNINL